MKDREARYAWAERVLKMYFTSPVYVGEDDGCPIFEVENICNRTLKLIIWDINKAMHDMGYNAHFSVHGNPVLDNVDSSRRGIKVKWTNIWKAGIYDLNGWGMNCIVRQSTKGHIPYDDLSKVNLRGDDIDYLRYRTEDGIGIEAKDIGFNVKIEAVQYCDCGGNPDDPNWDYTLVPCLWCYTGEIGEFRFQGLASEFGLALGKAIKAAYHGATKWEMETREGANVADMIKNNTVKWHTYGYCY